MAVDYKFKDKYNIRDLVEIMAILRAPGGCPWDAEQNHETIKKNLIEETYEVIEAINKNDKVLLLEELGDVLLQVVFHAQMETENGTFDFDDVADGVCKKLIERHPHVFGTVEVSGTEDVLTNWDAIKRNSKKQKTTSQAMDSVPRELPALMRADKLQAKAAKAGASIQGDSLDFVNAKAIALSGSVDSKSIGEMLFAVTALARQNGIDAEEALSQVSDKFLADFAVAESSVEKNFSSLYK